MNEFDLIKKMADEQNVSDLFNLKNNGAFSCALHRILMNQYEKEPSSLNEIQLNLFLCMHLENAGQADHILSFLQEWFPHYQKRIVDSLKRIGAVKSSEIIERAIKLLPDDGTWFFNSSNDEDEKLMSELDTKFSGYPDGAMCNLIRSYAEENKAELFNLI